MLNKALYSLLAFDSEGIATLPVTANKGGEAVVEVTKDVSATLTGVKARVGDNVKVRMNDGELVLAEVVSAEPKTAARTQNSGSMNAPERELM